MTKEQIAELRRLEAEAVNAPWAQDADGWIPGVVTKHENGACGDPECCGGYEERIEFDSNSAALIIAARNALPRLLDEREALLEAMRLLVFETGQMYAPIAVLDAMRAAIAKAEAP